MRSINNFIVTALVVGVLSSCETDIDYEGDAIDNFMVLNSIVIADSAFECRVTKSTTILEPNIMMSIVDAKVQLYENGEFLEDMIGDGNGNYYSSQQRKASILNRYAIRVSHGDYNNIEGSTLIPDVAKAKILSINPKQSDYGHSDELKFELEVSDPVGEDFYRLKIEVPILQYNEVNGNFDLEEPFEYSTMSLTSKDPVLNNNTVSGNNDEFGDIPPNNYQVFDDVLFDGENYNLSFEVSNYYYSEISIDPELLNKYLKAIKVDVQKISKDLHQYFVSVEASQYYEDSPFSEPVRVNTNVKGGAGILGGVSSTIIKYEP